MDRASLLAASRVSSAAVRAWCRDCDWCARWGDCDALVERADFALLWVARFEPASACFPMSASICRAPLSQPPAGGAGPDASVDVGIGGGRSALVVCVLHHP
eukprot:9220881-Alexandrium_andersonii.AAC.1